MELVDAKLGSELNEEQVMVMINVALLCSDVSPSVRPSMSTVVSLLEGRAAIQDFVPDSIVSLADDKTKSDSEAMRNQSISLNGPSTASSTSIGDLYPINLDSDYWKGRD
ncbi:hypothetical protein ACOSQ4_031479 [Xanthoceras sorbifolium]